MALDSATYFLFLACVAALQAVLPTKGRFVLLLGASLGFYAVSSVSYLILLLVMCGFNYAAVLGLSRIREKRQRAGIFAVTVVLNLVMLILFKYERKFIGSLLGSMGFVGLGSVQPVALAVPLGLSYFTFQMLACVTDAYRGTWVLNGGLARFVLFGFFFPQVSSGPIPRADRLFPQLCFAVKPTTEDRLQGLRLIAYGLFKKFVVANRLNDYISRIFENQLPFSTLPTLLACCFNALQLYADFSGYVDIAIGSARFLGIRLDPNFNHPFTSKSISEFWRRWHMTLSFWLRDYLFLPLRIYLRIHGNAGTVIALLVTFGVCGLWHAATVPFLLLGLAYGSAISAELLTKSWRAKHLNRLPVRWVALAGSGYTLSLIVLTQVLFRSPDLSTSGWIYAELFDLKWVQSLGELFAYHGPLFFILDFVVIGIWAALSAWLQRLDHDSTPVFLFACALLILFLGRLGSPLFIYAAY